jgi:hypothetical protein
MKIEFIKEVVFTDMEGTTVKVYNIGDRVECTAKTSTYYITSMGGIYFHEAKEVLE